MPTDQFDVTRVPLGTGSLAEVLLQYVFDESGAGLIRSCDAIDPRQNLFRQCDGSLLFHTTIIPPPSYPIECCLPADLPKDRLGLRCRISRFGDRPANHNMAGSGGDGLGGGGPTGLRARA